MRIFQYFWRIYAKLSHESLTNTNNGLYAINMRNYSEIICRETQGRGLIVRYWLVGLLFDLVVWVGHHGDEHVEEDDDVAAAVRPEHQLGPELGELLTAYKLLLDCQKPVLWSVYSIVWRPPYWKTNKQLSFWLDYKSNYNYGCVYCIWRRSYIFQIVPDFKFQSSRGRCNLNKLLFAFVPWKGGGLNCILEEHRE